jgi:ABC-type antimicrobial peptide transport system permease subunit
MVVGQALRPTLVGLVVGLLLALGTTRLMSSLLYGVSATDPATFATLAVLLCTVAVVASYIPGLRATRIDPISALRTE